MRYIKEYSNDAEYNAVKDSVELPNVSRIASNGNMKYNPERGLYFLFATSGTVTLTFSANATMDYVEYSTNRGVSWTRVTYSSGGTASATGQEVWFRGKGIKLYGSKFACSAACEIGGNIMSLLYGDVNFSEKTAFHYNSLNAFYQLFYGNTYITDASKLALPMMSLTASCYEEMFKGCTGLVKAPDLPATTLAGFCYRNMFNGCTSLVYPPILPATTLEIGCYTGMFQGCTSLKVTPKLPATTMTDDCYMSMFQGCTSLTSTPELPATTMSLRCYALMFQGCTALKNVSKLPATTMDYICYTSMFKDCTSLKFAPNLPATTLNEGCYKSMFQGCTSLIKAPDLPATTLYLQCYLNMFDGCTSLEEAPDLPATTLAQQCYGFMFNGCSRLKKINAAFTTTPTRDYTESWVNGVAASGKFYKNMNASWNVTGANGVPTGWTTPFTNPLCFTATASGTFTLTIPSGIPTNILKSVSYTTDGWNWVKTLNTGVGATITTPTIAANGKVWWKADGLGTSVDGSNPDESSYFSSTANFTVSGNILSMAGDETNAATSLLAINANFGWLFKNCTKLTSASALTLGATTLNEYCYAGLFYGCSNLTAIPSLPATTLAAGCYSYMFYGCTSLTSIPTLSATSLKACSYEHMFEGCTGLTGTPSLPATTISAFSYYMMFKGCTGLTGTINLPATTLYNSCYAEMFRGCTHITRVNIYGTTFAGNCCHKMMYGCSALSTVQCMSLTEPHAKYTDNWLYGVAASGTYIKNANATWLNSRGVTWIPINWTVTTA